MSSLRHRFPGARDGWARFDGPAGTQVVDSAITAMTNWLSDGSNGCGGGYFAAALKADELMERARATVGRLFNADPAGIAFGANMTSITFALSRAIGETAPIITIGALTFIAFLPPPLVTPDFPFLSFEWLKAPFTVMPIQMFNWTSRPDEAFHANAAAAGTILVFMTLLMNGLAIYLRFRLRKNIKW